MTLDHVMAALAAKGSDSIKRTLAKHGAREPYFGVKIADLKILEKKLRGDQALAMKLYASGNGDAQYLAGLIARGQTMTPAQLDSWAKTAAWNMISGTIVPWVASEHPDGLGHALKWIDSAEVGVAVSGWDTLSALAATTPDQNLPVKQWGALLDRVAKTLPAAPNEVRSAMNSFVIACGTYIASLGEKSIATARRLGRVEIDVGETACVVPDAETYILKRRCGAAVAPKRKTVRC